jgi:hypothetical protein
MTLIMFRSDGGVAVGVVRTSAVLIKLGRCWLTL